MVEKPLTTIYFLISGSDFTTIYFAELRRLQNLRNDDRNLYSGIDSELRSATTLKRCFGFFAYGAVARAPLLGQSAPST